MIEMPRRSVTRFFIPMIDVLLLLFCIFLLMPLSSETDMDKERETAAEQSESVEVLQFELQRRSKELNRLEKLRPGLEEVGKLREEVERLRNAPKLPLQERAYFQVIDVDAKTGEIAHFDAARGDQPFLKIADEKSAKALIERHQRDAKEREVYYYFLLPRPATGYPTVGQERRYKAWFAKIANSLQESRP